MTSACKPGTCFSNQGIHNNEVTKFQDAFLKNEDRKEDLGFKIISFYYFNTAPRWLYETRKTEKGDPNDNTGYQFETIIGIYDGFEENYRKIRLKFPYTNEKDRYDNSNIKNINNEDSPVPEHMTKFSQKYDKDVFDLQHISKTKFCISYHTYEYTKDVYSKYTNLLKELIDKRSIVFNNNCLSLNLDDTFFKLDTKKENYDFFIKENITDHNKIFVTNSYNNYIKKPEVVTYMNDVIRQKFLKFTVKEIKKKIEEKIKEKETKRVDVRKQIIKYAKIRLTEEEERKKKEEEETQQTLEEERIRLAEEERIRLAEEERKKKIPDFIKILQEQHKDCIGLISLIHFKDKIKEFINKNKKEKDVVNNFTTFYKPMFKNILTQYKNLYIPNIGPIIYDDNDMYILLYNIKKGYLYGYGQNIVTTLRNNIFTFINIKYYYILSYNLDIHDNKSNMSIFDVTRPVTTYENDNKKYKTIITISTANNTKYTKDIYTFDTFENLGPFKPKGGRITRNKRKSSSRYSKRKRN